MTVDRWMLPAELARADEPGESSSTRTLRDWAVDVTMFAIAVLDGVAATAALGRRTREPAPAVVMLTTFDADETVLAALRAGAAGFLLKHTPPEQIVDAVRRAAAGEPVLSPDVTRTVIAMAAGPGSRFRTDPDGPADRAGTRSRARRRRRAEQRGNRRTAHEAGRS